MFLGVSFASDNTCASNTAAAESNITRFEVANVIMDELYATGNVLIDFNWQIPDTWTFDTKLHAVFQGNTYAGNVDFTESIVEKIKIKKRFKGDFTWKTIYEQPVTDKEDLAIRLWDYWEPSNREVEYAYVAVIGGADTKAISTSVLSEFDNYFMVDNEISHPLILDVRNSTTYERASSVTVSPGCKYPYVTHNGKARYYSGKMEVTFIELNNCQFDVENGWMYRRQMDEWLTDGRAKILKSMEGEMWMINTHNNISRTTKDHYQYITHSFDYVECGNPEMVADLYDYGFIDTDVDREY